MLKFTALYLLFLYHVATPHHQGHKSHRPHKLNRIFGGDSIMALLFPSNLELVDLDHNHVCSGVIVYEDYFLTAAHCLEGRRPDSLLAVSIIRAYFTIWYCKTHPMYQQNGNTYDCDIAICRIQHYFDDDGWSSPIEIINSLPSAGRLAWTMGWGRNNIDNIGSFEDELQVVEVPINSMTQCQYYYPGKITNFEVCAGGIGGSGPCYGDEGAPLVYDGYLVGVLSWVEGCGWNERPGVYVDMTQPNIKNWMNAMINNPKMKKTSKKKPKHF